MAAFTHSQPQVLPRMAAANDLVERVGAVFASLRGGVLRAMAYSRTVNELSALTDRQLADIGLERADIEGTAWSLATRR